MIGLQVEICDAGRDNFKRPNDVRVPFAVNSKKIVRFQLARL